MDNSTITNGGVGAGQDNGGVVVGMDDGGVGAVVGQDQGVAAVPVEQGEVDALIDQMSNEQLMDAFVSQMMEEKGVKAGMSEADFAAAKGELISQLNYAINRAILAGLPEEKLDEVEGILDGGGDIEKIDQIIEEAGVDVSGATERAMLEFRGNYLGKKED